MGDSFIEQIAGYVKKYAPKYGICVCSPIIAQAILESAKGKSELALRANNYFGLKYRAGRCPTSCGIYFKVGSEQNADGTYTSSAMEWFKFPNMESGVIGYFNFINISSYSSLKGVTDPKTYLDNIKKAKYATSINYVPNLMSVIDKYDLTKYDRESGEKIMKINVHAGHNPDGKVACGAIGLIRESTEARKVKELTIKYLREQGHTVYDCTVEDGANQTDVLNKIVNRCNANSVDLNVSIHFNAGGKSKSDLTTTGTECLIYSDSSGATTFAANITKSISELGFTNRGVKYRPGLAVLKRTVDPAVLVECCFVDDPDDVKLYDPDAMAKAIVKGITGKAVTIVTASSSVSATATLYKVQCGAYKNKKNAEALVKKLKEAGFTAIIV